MAREVQGSNGGRCNSVPEGANQVTAWEDHAARCFWAGASSLYGVLTWCLEALSNQFKL